MPEGPAKRIKDQFVSELHYMRMLHSREGYDLNVYWVGPRGEELEVFSIGAPSAELIMLKVAPTPEGPPAYHLLHCGAVSLEFRPIPRKGTEPKKSMGFVADDPDRGEENLSPRR